MLDREVTLSTTIQPACLPDPLKGVYPNTPLTSVWAAGWGTLSSGGSAPNTLYNVKMTYYNGTDQCRYVTSEVTTDWTRQICAGLFLKLKLKFNNIISNNKVNF